MALAAGATFGPYRVIEQLGKGGMASVYKAYEAALDRYVALKVLPPEFLAEESFAERFEREAKVVAKLEHPNIIPIFSYGIEAGVPWMAMRLIPAGTLSMLLSRNRLAHAEVVRIIAGVAEALDYAHAKGVLHRDIKPQNVLLDESGRIYLADFGIAKMAEGSSALTQAGMISGTPNYMAPEQGTGTKVDHRCDIYALGVMAYEMLTGSVPFTADTPVAVLMKHLSDPIPLPSLADVPESLFRPVLKAMAKKPEDRWSRATELGRALHEGLAEVAAAASAATGVLPRLAPPPTDGKTARARVLTGTVPPLVPTIAAAPPARPPLAARPSPTPISPLAAIKAIVAILGVAALSAVALLLWTMRRRVPEASPTPVSASTVEAPVRPIEASTEPPAPVVASLAPSAPALAPPPAAAPTPRPAKQAVTATSRPAVDPALRQPSPPPAPAGVTEASPATTLIGAPSPSAAPVPATRAPSIELELEVIKDPGGPWNVSVLYLRLSVGERMNRVDKDVVVAFDGQIRRSETVTIPGIPTGQQRLLVAASKSPTMESEETIQGAKEIALGEGVNRVGLQVRFLGPDDWTIRFR